MKLREIEDEQATQIQLWRNQRGQVELKWLEARDNLARITASELMDPDAKHHEQVQLRSAMEGLEEAHAYFTEQIGDDEEPKTNGTPRQRRGKSRSNGGG